MVDFPVRYVTNYQRVYLLMHLDLDYSTLMVWLYESPMGADSNWLWPWGWNDRSVAELPRVASIPLRFSYFKFDESLDSWNDAKFKSSLVKATWMRWHSSWVCLRWFFSYLPNGKSTTEACSGAVDLCRCLLEGRAWARKPGSGVLNSWGVCSTIMVIYKGCLMVFYCIYGDLQGFTVAKPVKRAWLGKLMRNGDLANRLFGDKWECRPFISHRKINRIDMIRSCSGTRWGGNPVWIKC